MGINGETLAGPLDEFNNSEHAACFSRCYSTLEKRYLGQKHFNQITAAIAAKRKSCLRIVFGATSEDDREKGVDDRFSYMDPDTDNPERHYLNGFVCVAASNVLEVMERPFPLEILLKKVEQQHFRSSQYGINLQGKAFNEMTAIAIAMTNVLTKRHGSLEEAQRFGRIPMLLPGLRGAYFGYAEALTDPDSLMPFEALFRMPDNKHEPISTRREESDVANSTPIESPSFIIVIDSFVAEEKLRPEETKVFEAFKKMIDDEEINAGIGFSSHAYFSGGFNRRIAIDHMAYDIKAKEYEAREQRWKLASQQLNLLLDGDAWFDFSNNYNRYIPSDDATLDHEAA